MFMFQLVLRKIKFLKINFSNLNNCGFSISNGDNGLYILSGYIIHIFPDTN